MRLFWFILGHILVGIAVLGIFLPVLPTTPILLLALACYSKSSERFENWLLNHPRLGPSLRDWKRYGAISRSIKWKASFGMAIAICFPAFIVPVPKWVLVVTLILIAIGAIYVWTRPEKKLE